MTSSLSIALRKYSVPSIFFVAGIIMIALGVSTKQTSMWFISSVMVLIAGLLSVSFSGGFFKSSMGKIIGAVAGIAAAYAIYLAFNSVNETQAHNELYKESVILVHENLNNIRTAQKAYKEKNGVYAKTWEELEQFIIEGTVPEVISEGFIPVRKLTPEESKFIYKDNRPQDNNMTEKEAYILSKSAMCPEELKDFKRDTVMVSFLKKQFLTASYMEKRNKMNLGKFYADSLKYIPYTKAQEKFEMTTIDSVLIGSDKVPVLEVKGKYPIAEIHGSKVRKKVFFGSLTLPDLSGSWE